MTPRYGHMLVLSASLIAMTLIVSLPVSASEDAFTVDGVGYSQTGPAEVTVTGGDRIGDLVLTDVVTHDGVSYDVISIEEGAFSGDAGLRSVTVTGIRTIGRGAFEGCTSLTTAELGEGLVSIQSYAFANTGLRQVSLPSTLETLGDAVFGNTDHLHTISVGSNPNYSSESGALYDMRDRSLVRYPVASPATSYAVPAGALFISNGAFQGASNLVSIDIPGSVVQIGDSAISDCRSLLGLDLPSDLAVIGHMAFSNNESLRSVTVPGSLMDVGDMLFYQCPSLTDVVLGEGLTAITADMFGECPSLTGVALPGSLTMIMDGAFSYCSAMTDIIIPANVFAIGESVFTGCRSLQSIDVDPANQSFHSEQGSLIGTLDGRFVQYPLGNDAEDYTVPSGVKTIGSHAFSGSAIRTVTLPEGVLNIESGAFSQSAIENIALPHSLSAIGPYAFEHCEGLSTIIIPAAVSSIGQSAFLGCSSLGSIHVEWANRHYMSEDGVLFTEDGKTLVQFPGGKSEKVYFVPAETEAIEPYAFSMCYGLMAIDVEEGNPRYSSANGVLTDKSGSTLIQIPSGMVGEYRVPEAIGHIQSLAIYGCYDISLTFYRADVQFDVMSLCVGDDIRQATLEIRGPSGLQIPESAYDVNTTVELNKDVERDDTVSIALGIAVTLFALVTSAMLFSRRRT